MRVAIIVVAIILAIIFVGGAVPLGSRPLFGHIDAVLGITALMDLHYGLFSMIYRGEDSVGDGYQRTRTDIDRMQQQAEFGKKKKYQQLDRASQN